MISKLQNCITFLFVFFTISISAQRILISAEDKINIFDGYGNSYKTSDVIIDINRGKSNSKSSFATCSSGYFTLHFTVGSGMELEFDPIHIQRRSVVCQVFNDLSNMINSPLTTSGNTVNIWVRDITEVIGYNSNMLGVASSFYSLPTSPNIIQGGIADNEIWKTINSGVDSYTNVISPLLASDSSASFYHGMVAVNFKDITNWHTDLSTNAPVSYQDLYTLVLHEVTHALGFSSLIDQDGISKFGADYNYYNRYDTLLKDSNGTPLITSSGCSSMYDYTFTANTDVLHPSCTSSPPVNNSGNILDSTNCSTAITFGSNNIPVYNPDCYESGSSLSHFEDQCYVDTNTGSPYGNNLYFVMSNANGSGVTKRTLTVEETQVLCDIGYTMNNIAGSTCSGVSVSGVNDGFNGSTFAFTGNIGDPIDLNTVTGGILLNDINTTGFECLEDVYNNSSIIPITSGTAITTGVTFTGSVPGLNLLRYVPTNGSDKGNITYIYIYLNVDNSCGIPTACDLVINGDFEQNSGFPDGSGQTYKICNLVTPSLSSPEFYHASSTSIHYSVPSNSWGNEPDFIPGNSGYVGMFANTSVATNRIYTETIRLQLKEPLAPNTTYNISFNTSLADRVVNNNWGSKRLKFQAYLTTNPNDHLGQDTPSTVFDSPIFSETSNGWDTNVIQIQTGNVAGQDYLFIGAINNASELDVGCNNSVNNCRLLYYYVDNVSLKRVDTNSFNLPEDICFNNTLDDLSLYLTPANPGGQFTGNGVAAGAFDSSIAGLGTHTITYTYINNLGCEIILNDTIEVINTPPTDATFVVPNSDCLTLTFQANDIYANHAWDFNNDGIPEVSGSGSDVANTNPSYTFSGLGSYPITHIVTNDCGSLSYQENIDVTCGCIGSTTWNGTAWSNDNPDINKEVIIDGNYDTLINGSFSACALIVNAGATLLIQNATYVEVQKESTVSGDLQVETHGAFVQNLDLINAFTVNSGGSAIVNKQTTLISNWYEYTYWSSPIVNETVGDALDIAPANRRFWFNAQNYLDQYLDSSGNTVLGSDDIDDNGNDWQIATAGSIMTPGVGYAATAAPIGLFPGTHSAIFEGEFNNGIIETPIYVNGLTTDNDWNFIGNPYPSAIDFDDLYALNSGLIGGSAYLWSHASPPDIVNDGNEGLNFNANDYAIITVGSGNIAGNGTLTDNNIPNSDNTIPSGQGFFVKGLSNGILTFNNSMRKADLISNNQFFRSSNETTNTNRLWLNLTTESGIFNQILIAYVDGATSGFDGFSFDATRSLYGGNTSILFTKIENDTRRFAIQGKNPSNLNLNEVIPFSYYSGLDDTTVYTISIPQLEGDFLTNNTIYIRDKLLNIVHNLSAEHYSFYSEMGEFNERFEIVFNQENLSIKDHEIAAIEVFPNPTTSIIHVKSETTIISLQLFNNLGQLILSKPEANYLDLSRISEGIYFLKAIDLYGNTKSVPVIKK
ncbi:T9SS type A sorting domain-containing protein [Winogradskyella sp. Asnod2-B02-A]|uniref:T9SS type A sorting domain-containing protein n=1 Tax=Winogradskyella sp. Asnod2-B02-A TaxID=3160583 RepID=UPI00386A2C11